MNRLILSFKSTTDEILRYKLIMIIIFDHYFFDKSTFFNMMLIFRINVWLKRSTQSFILKFFIVMNFVLMSRFIVNANLNTFVVFVFVLIKKVFEENENFFINFVREIIDVWMFDFIVQLNADITSVVILVKKKFHDVSMNKIHFSTIKNDIIIMIFKLFDIASA